MTTTPKSRQLMFEEVVTAAGYNGRLDLTTDAPDLKDLLLDLQRYLLDAYESQRNCLSVGDRSPLVYFDYIKDSGDVNTLAFSTEGWAMVGVTHSLVQSLALELWNACSRPDFRVFFLPPSATIGQYDLYVVLYLTAVQFVINHEFGHHVHGHVPFSNERAIVRKEFIGICIGDDLESQADEVEADCYSVQMTLNNLARNYPRKMFRQIAGPNLNDDELDSLILRCFLASAIFFFHLLDEAFDVAKVYTQSHPFCLARLNKIAQQMGVWCEENCPSLGSWPSLDLFSELGSAVRAALPSANDSWDAQSAWLTSPAGENYLNKDLQAARELRRKQVEDFVWHIDRKCMERIKNRISVEV